MLPIDVTGDRVVDLSILFALLTVGVGVIVLIMALVFIRLIRQEQDEAHRVAEEDRTGATPSDPAAGVSGSLSHRGERQDNTDTTPPTAHGTPDPRPGR